jgi:hypothetical protein
MQRDGLVLELRTLGIGAVFNAGIWPEFHDPK